MKPQLAKDALIDKINYPVLFQPKIDGVRALNLTGTLTGRSLDPLKGFGITEYFSKPEFVGLDGEMIAGDDPACRDRLCSRSTGATGRFKGVTEMADVSWWCFDLLLEHTKNLSYYERYVALQNRVLALGHPRIRFVPAEMVRNRAELDKILAKTYNEGYEGGIIRNPTALAKEGRPDKLQQLMRFKPWSDAEMLVTGVTEGNSNENEAMTNSLGRTERSSSQEGMVPNGRIGSIQGIMLADFFNPLTKELMFPKGLPITVSKGEMTNEEAQYYFENQSEIVNHVVKFKHMTHGVKDLPRFGGYISHRMIEDM